MSARKKSYSGFGMGFLRPFAAVLVLTAFILTITFAVRGLGELKTDTLVAKSKPLLARINIDVEDNKIGMLATTLLSRVPYTNFGGDTANVREDITEEETVAASTPSADEQPQVAGATTSTLEPEFRIALMADAHSDYENLNKALDTTKQLGVSTVYFLGDFTKLGVIDDLKNAKSVMDSSELKYYAISGDHDLWHSVGHDNYHEVFGDKKHSVIVEDVKFVFLDNSANYTTVPSQTIEWFKKEAVDADFVVLSQPLYATKLDRYMGRINGEDVKEVLDQRNDLLSFIRGTEVRAVIAADLHTSHEVSDPEKPNLEHILIGALTSELNLQSPRFSIFKYYEDSSYEFENVVLE
jgi:predicted phosphodiesterase